VESESAVSSFVFVGPTLKPADVLEYPGMTFLPPAEQGDVYDALASKPTAIGLIDGRFHDVPAVWHKELLWALHNGVRVYGAASMGALRAVELHPFGMRGIGWIFESFLDGTFEDDDEVAVSHGDQDMNFTPGSDAMVNIRRTLGVAHEADVISDLVRDALIAIAKSMDYPLRNYGHVLRSAWNEGWPSDELVRLEAWLPANRVDQKRLDALAMLGLMQTEAETGEGPGAPDFTFERTSFFEFGYRSAHADHQ
jgi:hypothetical protein